MNKDETDILITTLEHYMAENASMQDLITTDMYNNMSDEKRLELYRELDILVQLWS